MSKKRGKRKVIVKKIPTKKFVQTEVNVEAITAAINDVKDQIERRARAAEMKFQMGIGKIEREVEAIKSNQIVLQTMLAEQKIIGFDEFHKEFETFMREKVGVVDPNGRMEGNVIIDIFNVGREVVPVEMPDKSAPQMVFP
jgi:hypothetical protein